MGFLDPGKILVILVIALIVLGPERLPRLARQAGAAWRELTRVREQVTEEIRSAMPDMDLPSIPRMPTNVVSGFIADLTRPSVTSTGAEAAGGAEVRSDVAAPGDELVSSSSSGDEGTSAWAAGTAVTGDLGPEESAWSAARAGSVSARSSASSSHSFGELPVVADDPSMN